MAQENCTQALEEILKQLHDFQLSQSINILWKLKSVQPIISLSAKSTQPPPSAFQAVKTKMVNNGEEVLFTAQISTEGKGHDFGERFIAVKDCRATPDHNFDSNEGVTLIENG